MYILTHVICVKEADVSLKLKMLEALFFDSNRTSKIEDIVQALHLLFPDGEAQIEMKAVLARVYPDRGMIFDDWIEALYEKF